MTRCWMVSKIAVAAFSIAMTLSCSATRSPEPPSEPSARALLSWSRGWGGEGQAEDDPRSIWIWSLRVTLPDDDLECEVEFRSDPRLVETGWIEEHPCVRVTRAGHLDEDAKRDHFFFGLSPLKSGAPRSYFVGANSDILSDSLESSEPQEFESPDEESSPAPPSPPPETVNGTVPRAVADRLVSLRGEALDDKARGHRVTLHPDDVVMKWAVSYLRSEFAKSSSR